MDRLLSCRSVDRPPRRYRAAIDRLPSAGVLEFRILGPLEVVAEGRQVALGGPRQRATLAILLLDANRVVPVERLADELYAGRPPVTAVTQVQRQVSELRRALGSATAIETRPPGYVLPLASDGLDLSRFERLTTQAAASGPETAAGLLREALGLWRGPPLADVSFEPFALAAAERLEELRVTAVEALVDAELDLGEDEAAVIELRRLLHEHPLRERTHGRLMLALYRAGRQAEAVQAFHEARRVLDEELGLEPSRELDELFHRILRQDESLAGGTRAAAHSRRSGGVLVVPGGDDSLAALVDLAGSLADGPPRELLVVRLVGTAAELAGAAASLGASRASLPAGSRTATFTTDDPGRDLVRLARAHEVDLVLADADGGLDDGQVPSPFAALLDRSPADVALVAARPPADAAAAVFVPFAGGEHDWAALELAAGLASGGGRPLRLVGTTADPPAGRRDASRLLADAALALQRVADVDVAPVLADPDRLVDVVDDAGLVVAGMSPRWRSEGIGAARLALVRDARPTVVLVHRGLRPGVLAPPGSRTRFTWTLGL
jgi:DNA-binding SARP family transcriptional activator